MLRQAQHEAKALRPAYEDVARRPRRPAMKLAVIRPYSSQSTQWFTEAGSTKDATPKHSEAISDNCRQGRQRGRVCFQASSSGSVAIQSDTEVSAALGGTACAGLYDGAWPGGVPRRPKDARWTMPLTALSA